MLRFETLISFLARQGFGGGAGCAIWGRKGSRMRYSVLLACTLAAAAMTCPSGAARLVNPGVGISWGKAGISLAQYRQDAIACGQSAAATDLAGTDPAKALVLGSRLIENDTTVGPGPVIDPMSGPSAAPDALAGA